ncbi:UNVERIFIED_ORG: hypothetical protein FNL38_105318 [Nocardia globerula]|uniref:Uncharacterized protein n=1 Tax=Nocardia globerula TaxID=1818 RepID=A0A652YMS8_NOCGL|nr:hypothetical protein [Rhodococcus globerulus]NMD62362.1 hypothetical protein [Nocardia globerula]PVX65542.1 hypothetical protein C8E04_2843 [Rhodococcus globerulus]
MVATRKHSAGGSTPKARRARLHLVADLAEADDIARVASAVSADDELDEGAWGRAHPSRGT